ncbi:unnamed protein product, partial [Amoebophrya sp. A25]|eukprot:GSA25T00013651001.1
MMSEETSSLMWSLISHLRASLETFSSLLWFTKNLSLLAVRSNKVVTLLLLSIDDAVCKLDKK